MIKKFNEYSKVNEDLSSQDKDDLVDILQTFKALQNIEEGQHPTIKTGSDEYLKFKNWAVEKYFDSGMIDKFINEL